MTIQQFSFLFSQGRSEDARRGGKKEGGGKREEGGEETEGERDEGDMERKEGWKVAVGGKGREIKRKEDHGK